MARAGGSYERIDGKLVLKQRTLPVGVYPQPEQSAPAEQSAQPQASGHEQAQSDADTSKEG